MLPVIAEPRKELSPFAPKMLTMSINPEKIGDVIGKQGKVIQKLQELFDCVINIEEDGRVFISTLDSEKGQAVMGVIEIIAKGPEVGAFYQGTVTRLMEFGAFVEIAPGVEGLVHISKLDVKRVGKVEDVVSVGDLIKVKVTEIDDRDRINLSRRDALIELDGMVAEDNGDEGERRPKKDGNRSGFRRR